jgi:trans-2,3-dihydro-3-hydroxyanthranilate isomerase
VSGAASRRIDRLAEFAPLAQLADQREGALRRYAVLDVFTEVPLEGNPLGVFTDARGLATETMQRLARELRLSETVFVLPPTGPGDARIRIFTPTNELPFAGHPVLGAAVVIGLALERSAVTLETGLGAIPVQLTLEQGKAVFGRMQQPVPSWRPYEREAELLAALGAERSGLPVEAYENGPLHVYVELPSARAVAALAPDMRALANLGAVCANCFAADSASVRTRMFAPALGVDEDPATGSAAGPLAVHLSRHGKVPFGEEIEIRQGAEIGRPSVLYARAEGSAEQVLRVEVGGSAVIVAGGEFLAG